ncbi:hypothetical protein NCCP2145_40520 [Pseudarthrobacter sp. NCCP-2145]|nr:hypothetical protein NCCP2145_40520 [Pseudarthrobacter sp. NCCP-2145]
MARYSGGPPFIHDGPSINWCIYVDPTKLEGGDSRHLGGNTASATDPRQHGARDRKVRTPIGPTWTEIATCLGITRQTAWERGHEIDETLPEGEAWDPSSLRDSAPERLSGTE